MGKAKPKKKFTGRAARSNPEGISPVTEEEIQNGCEDVWHKIADQLQSGKTCDKEFVVASNFNSFLNM